jgi:hypothetical protein
MVIEQDFFIFKFLKPPSLNVGHMVAWLRHYATSQKVAVLIPDEVIGFFN